MPAPQAGFTLMETMVSVMILAMMGVVITQVLFTTIRVNTKTAVVQEVKQNSEYALTVMEQVIRNGRDVMVWDSDTSTYVCDGSHGTKLKVTNPDESTTEYSCAVPAVAVGQAAPARLRSETTTVAGVTTTGYLTSSEVTLGNPLFSDTSNATCPTLEDDPVLTFTCTDVVDTPKLVTVQFAVGQKVGGKAQYEKAEFGDSQSSLGIERSIYLRNK